jgi:hypothetical protein
MEQSAGVWSEERAEVVHLRGAAADASLTLGIN